MVAFHQSEIEAAIFDRTTVHENVLIFAGRPGDAGRSDQPPDVKIGSGVLRLGFWERWRSILERFKLVRGNTAVLRSLVVGRQTTDLYEVVSGLVEGDTVVVSGQNNLADQTRVQVVNLQQ